MEAFLQPIDVTFNTAVVPCCARRRTPVLAMKLKTSFAQQRGGFVAAAAC
jgi:hypothetical protein